MNRGYITNLPYDSCVEVPIYADRSGLNPVVIGNLPSHLAALNQSNVTVQSLAAEAALKGDPELAFSAIAMDPLTSSVLTLKEIRDMTIEMFEAHKAYLPSLKAKEGRHYPRLGNGRCRRALILPWPLSQGQSWLKTNRPKPSVLILGTQAIKAG